MRTSCSPLVHLVAGQAHGASSYKFTQSSHTGKAATNTPTARPSRSCGSPRPTTHPAGSAAPSQCACPGGCSRVTSAKRMLIREGLQVSGPLTTMRLSWGLQGERMLTRCGFEERGRGRQCSATGAAAWDAAGAAAPPAACRQINSTGRWERCTTASQMATWSARGACLRPVLAPEIVASAPPATMWLLGS